MVLAPVLGLLLAACVREAPTVGGGTPAPPASPAAAECARENLTLVSPGQLTVGTDIPAFPPWFGTGAPVEDVADLGPEGYEGAVAYAVAERLGFGPDEVVWTYVPFNQSYKPGPKPFDFDINQISYTAKRDRAVDFSESYYDVNQALVALEGTPITESRSLEDLRPYTLATQIGTTSFDYIVQVIQPEAEPGAYDRLIDSIQALKAGQVDGIVVDLPTAFYVTAVQVPKGVIVGQFPPAGGVQEYFAMAFEEGNPLVACVNRALEELKADGTLQALQAEWLSSRVEVPVFQT